MKTAHIDTSRAIALVLMLILFIGLLAISQHVQRPNNGDGWRVLRSAQIAAPKDYYKNQPFPRFTAFKPLHDIKPADLVPMSSSAVVVEAVSFIERMTGFGQFDFAGVTAFYLALYLLGILLIALEIHLLSALALLFVLANPYVLAYFNSPYEESLFLALCPLMSYLFLKSRSYGLAGRATALAMASAKVQFVPAFLLGIKSWRIRHNLFYLLLSLLLICAVALKASKFNEPNSYNRYFNGLAYSMAHVSAWPARDFTARRSIAAGMVMVQPPDVVFPADASNARKYWGSSFWPTGDKLAPGEQAYLLQHEGKWFRQTVLANTHTIPLLLTEPILTMGKADYRMDYIFGTDFHNKWLDLHASIMKHFGIVFLLASICSAAIALRNRKPIQVLFVLFCFLYPLPAVFGDGYYEFEKHVFPVLFLSAVFSLSLVLMTLATYKQSNAFKMRSRAEQRKQEDIAPGNSARVYSLRK